MKKYVIITDSCSDLEKELRDLYDIDYIPMHITLDGKEYEASLDWKDFSQKEFYNILREGKRFITSQINLPEYINRFKKYLDEGYDILSISCSSKLSNSVNNSFAARDELLKEYPDAKIYCIDSLNACYGLGLLCITASTLRKQGKSIEETASYIEEHKLEMNQLCTPESLSYLKRAGRVNPTAALMGGLFNIKPIIISDAVGQNTSVEKVKGRQSSIIRLTELFKEYYRENPYQKIFFGHADCYKDVELLKEIIMHNLDNKDIPVHIGYIGPIVGASAGPGTIAVYFFGKEVTHIGK